MAKKASPGLGKGFDSLIPKHVQAAEFDPKAGSNRGVARTKNVLIQDVKPNPDQPRRQFNEAALNELVVSIQSHGILQPLIVHEVSGSYQIIAGERRWRAATMAGLETVPVIIRSPDQQQQMEIALIENLQREDLNALEMAAAFLQLIEQHNMDFKKIGKRVGKNESTIQNTIRLLGLPDKAKEALIKGKISEGHARSILALKDPKQQEELLELIIKGKWTVRKAEQYVVAVKSGAASKESAAKRIDVETEDTKALGKALKTEVKLQHMAKGGRLLISYKDEKDLKRITKKLLD